MKKGTFKKKTLVKSIEYAFSHKHNTKIRILMTMQFILSVIKISKEHNGIYKAQSIHDLGKTGFFVLNQRF